MNELITGLLVLLIIATGFFLFIFILGIVIGIPLAMLFEWIGNNINKWRARTTCYTHFKDYMDKDKIFELGILVFIHTLVIFMVWGLGICVTAGGFK